MANRVAVLIRPDGRVEYLNSRAAALLAGSHVGKRRTRRASHVVPVGPLRRFAFRIIRAVCSDGSWLARWTRRWKCRWRVEVIGGPRCGPFGQRSDAIRWEVEYLQRVMGR
jgi:hypothetical protein